ncbi:hypothetical protein ADK52_25495 [Streptomyces sp. WM6372]|uniref:hypothetical protein n=1 Tax=Streptomyces sp. WM6372 TaxID=1415555 RepID=UPI0006AF079F|nr:hypothetical protein [Streptomyces sp. WM6372]KOU20945.1 hypothetical protein ADK52_25495 [Streptomyces sp. WM6372]
MPIDRHAEYRAINRMRVARQAAHLALCAAGCKAAAVTPADVQAQARKLSGLDDGPLSTTEACDALAYYTA